MEKAKSFAAEFVNYRGNFFRGASSDLQMFVISWDPNNKLFRARSAKVALTAGDENGSMELQHVLKQDEGHMISLF